MIDRDKLRLVGVEPKLVVKIGSILAAVEAIGFPMFVIEGLRTAERQHEHWLKGRRKNADGTYTITDRSKIVTYADGYKKKSNHQVAEDGYGHSVDCAFLDDPETLKVETWDAKQPWIAYGTMAETLGLFWGGRWLTLVDRPHVSDRKG